VHIPTTDRHGNTPKKGRPQTPFFPSLNQTRGRHATRAEPSEQGSLAETTVAKTAGARPSIRATNQGVRASKTTTKLSKGRYRPDGLCQGTVGVLPHKVAQDRNLSGLDFACKLQGVAVIGLIGEEAAVQGSPPVGQDVRTRIAQNGVRRRGVSFKKFCR